MVNEGESLYIPPKNNDVESRMETLLAKSIKGQEIQKIYLKESKEDISKLS